MPRDPFDPIAKRKLAIYTCVAASIIIAGCTLLLSLGTPVWRVLLMAGFTAAVFCVVVGSTIWLTGGRRSEVAVGPAGIRPPTRFIKALPYIFAAIILLQLAKLIQVITSK